MTPSAQRSQLLLLTARQGTSPSRDCRKLLSPLLLPYKKEVAVIFHLSLFISHPRTHTSTTLAKSSISPHISPPLFAIMSSGNNIVNVNGADDGADADALSTTARLVQEARGLMIKDKDGNQVPFRSLFTDKSPDERQLIIFIRHFFCGVSSPPHVSLDIHLPHFQSCEDYVKALAEYLHPNVLSSNKIVLTIIGCGDPQLIKSYAERTGCPYPIYCDPTQALHTKLHMVKTLAGSTNKASYHRRSYFNIVVTSTWNALQSAPSVIRGKNGPSDQNGGELLFQDGKLQWAHIMQTTTDHTSTDKLKSVLSLQ